MPIVVNSNIAALNAQRNVGISNSKLSQSLARLSSGLRINGAADDAAGLAIATKFQAQVRGIAQAVRNANNAISLVQTAEGGINTLTNILQRLRELAVQASSDDNTASDRANLTQEAEYLVSEFTRSASSSEFNTMTLLDGSFTGKYFQVGANYAQRVTFTITDARGRSVGGRAEYTGDIADGVTEAVNENFGAGEIKINDVDVAPTNEADDQYSVLDISSAAVTASGATLNNATLFINDTAISLGDMTTWSADGIAAALRDAVVDAGIANVTARTVDGSAWVLEATGGVNLKLAATNAAGTATSTIMADLGMTSVVAMWGESVAAAAVTNYNGESGAIAKAVAINAIKGTSGVLATAQANEVTGAAAVTGVTLASGDVYINGYDIGAGTVMGNDSTGALITGINAQATNTGVTASVDTDGMLVLTAADGRNITVTTRTAAIANSLGLSGTATGTSYVYRSDIQLNDDESFEITSASSVEDLTGTTATSASATSDVATYNVAVLEIDTQEHAQAALLTVDAAMDDLNAIRAQIGGVQNRLQFTVSNLEIASENMSASESRIKDADFAAEVATFTRNQILVQAGVAMLAQANTIPQIALQLLR
jgi:flagellin